MTGIPCFCGKRWPQGVELVSGYVQHCPTTCRDKNSPSFQSMFGYGQHAWFWCLLSQCLFVQTPPFHVAPMFACVLPRFSCVLIPINIIKHIYKFVGQCPCVCCLKTAISTCAVILLWSSAEANLCGVCYLETVFFSHQAGGGPVFVLLEKSNVFTILLLFAVVMGLVTWSWTMPTVQSLVQVQEVGLRGPN